MPWKKVRFKDQDVWAEVDPAGGFVADGGRVAIRYKADAGTKIYRAGASSLVGSPTAKIEDLPDGVSADAAKPAEKSSKASGFGSAGTRTVAQAAAAATDAKSRIGALDPTTILAFTDGGCRGNPGPAGAGAVVKLPDGTVYEASLHLGHGTNNIGELSAIGLAISLLEEAGVPPDAPVAVFSDSTYARGVLTQNWKAKANPELIATVKAALKGRSGTKLHWVAGHVGVAGNERADELANMGVAGKNTRRKLEATR